MREGFYWVKTITAYRGRGEIIEESPDLTIGFCSAGTIGRDKSHRPSWQLVGSDEVYYTYDKEVEIEHRQTCVIPVKRIEDIIEEEIMPPHNPDE